MSEDKIMDKIAKLIAKSEGTNHEAEAATFMEAAERLMLKYAIEQSQIDALNGERNRKEEPQSIKFDLDCSGQSWRVKRDVMFEILHAKKIKFYITEYVGRNIRDPHTRFHVAGYKSDIEFARMLFASITVQMERAFLNAEKPHGMHGKSWRSAFANGYTHRVRMRIREKFAEARRDVESESSSNALVLRDRDQMTKDLYDEMTRYMKLGRVTRTQMNLNSEGARRGAVAGDNADLGDPKFAGMKKELQA